MKEGSEGDGDNAPTSRDADSTVSNGGMMVGGGNTALANALLGITTTNGGLVHSTKMRAGDTNGRDKSFTCGICNRSFGYKHVLQNHERTHTGEKPFECKECHKRFTRDHHLKTHMRLHTGEKPYHCNHCERQFVQVANLRRHLRVHTGERPYACRLCSSRFSDSNQLKAHVLIHEGVKPFECTRCAGRFRRRHHLVHHKCPKDEANIGKPRRGRRPRAYDELPTMLSPVLQERLSAPVVVDRLPPAPGPVSLRSVITRKPASPPLTILPAHHRPPSGDPPPPYEHPPRYEGLRLMGLSSTPNGHLYHDVEQKVPLDMTVSSSASAPVSVIVPRITNHPPTYLPPTGNGGSVDGVLDLSNSRSDSEAEPIEEEVDEEDDDCADEGVDSEDSEDEERMRLVAWRHENNHRNHHHSQYVEDLRQGNGDRYREENNREQRPYGEDNNREQSRYGEDNNREHRYHEKSRENGYSEDEHSNLALRLATTTVNSS